MTLLFFPEETFHRNIIASVKATSYLPRWKWVLLRPSIGVAAPHAGQDGYPCRNPGGVRVGINLFCFLVWNFWAVLDPTFAMEFRCRWYTRRSRFLRPSSQADEAFIEIKAVPRRLRSVRRWVIPSHGFRSQIASDLDQGPENSFSVPPWVYRAVCYVSHRIAVVAR